MLIPVTGILHLVVKSEVLCRSDKFCSIPFTTDGLSMLTVDERYAILSVIPLVQIHQLKQLIGYNWIPFYESLKQCNTSMTLANVVGQFLAAPVRHDTLSVTMHDGIVITHEDGKVVAIEWYEDEVDKMSVFEIHSRVGVGEFTYRNNPIPFNGDRCMFECVASKRSAEMRGLLNLSIDEIVAMLDASDED
jgi:hypothetical protein